MNALLSRLRMRSLHREESDETTRLPGSVTSTDSSAALNPPQKPFVDRRIIPDIASFMNTLSPEENPSQGLKPPRREKQRTVKTPVRTGDQADDVSERILPRKSQYLQRPMTDSRFAQETSQSAHERQLPQEISSVSPFATFGRIHEQDAPVAGPSAPPSAWYTGSFDSLIRRRSSSSRRRKVQSKQASVTSLNRFIGPSRASSDVLPSHSMMSTSNRSSFSQSDETNDNDHVYASSSLEQSSSPQDSNVSRFQLTRSSHSARSHSAHDSAAVNSSLIFGSPHTFGHPSPAPRRSRSLNRTSESAPAPPPLPPLNHPELVSALASRSHVNVSRQPSNSAHPASSKYQQWMTRLHAKTYPPHRRSKTAGTSSKNSSILSSPSLTLGPSLRRYSSLPSRLFRDSSTERQLHGASSSPRKRTKSGRRASAEWNAKQATVGVASLLPSDFGWPAEVAQHLLKLSLGPLETGATDQGRQAARGRPEKAEPRVLRVSSQSETPCPCYPSRLIPALSDPLLLQSSTAQEAAESHCDHDSLHVMDTLSAIKQPTFNRDDSQVLNSNDAKDTLRRSSSASAPEDSLGKARGKRVFHKSAPSPVASTSKNLESISSSPRHSVPSTPPSSKSRSTNRPPRSASEPGLTSVPETPTNPKGKRKADDLEVTPPDQKNGHRATFVIPAEGRRPHRISETSGPPSSYHRKRARLSTTTPTSSPAHSRPGSAQKPAISASNTASWPSRTSGPAQGLFRSGSRGGSVRSTRRPESTVDRRSERRRSMSERSIPISALVAPHAPSIARSSQYHMRDPRRPPKIMPTEWVPHFKSDEEEGSPMHAWCFFIGFILFPIWWIAAFFPTPKTREVGGTDTEKAVTLDDPQVEHDARTWRKRCRIMSAISFLTYVPFIILVAIFVPRHT